MKDKNKEDHEFFMHYYLFRKTISLCKQYKQKSMGTALRNSLNKQARLVNKCYRYIRSDSIP